MRSTVEGLAEVRGARRVGGACEVLSQWDEGQSEG